MLHIIHTLGGCGGTVLSRCIGVLPHIALLSEINPASVKLFAHFDPLYQDRNWLHLLPDSELKRFSKLDLGQPDVFRDLIRSFYARAAESGRKLVLRDYNYVDFIGVPFVAEPPREFALCAALPEGIPTRSVAFIRHPVDQWASLCKHDIVRDVLTPRRFCEAYEVFLEKLSDIPVYRYETFVENPVSGLRAICQDLLLPFDPTFTERFHSFDAVTGDFSRHRETAITAPVKRAIEPRVLDEFHASKAFERVLEATGYTGAVAS